MYIKQTYDLGRAKEVMKYYPGNYGAPGKKRLPKRKRTPEDIARQNAANRRRYVQRLILANFAEGDYHLTLTYKKDERPESFEEAKARLSDFLGRMRRAYGNMATPFKYIAVTERGSRGAWHHHLIIEDKPELSKLLAKCWKYGGKYLSPLYENGEFETLADYLVKKKTKEKGGKTFTSSHNLIRPAPEREIIHRRRWRTEPKPEKGYEIIKDSVVNGENPVTGYPYQHYMMRRVAPVQHRRRRCRDG